MTDGEPQDVELLEAWAGGDQHAGAALVTRYFATLMRVFRNKVRNVDDAKELVSETMLACTRGHSEIVNRDFRKYMFGVAFNKLREHYRRALKRDREEVDFTSICVADFDGPNTPETVVARKAEVRLLARGLRRLSLQQQIVLELNYFEGERVPEIAALLELPAQTVYSQLRRGKERLAEIIRTLAEDPAVVDSTMVGLETWAVQVRQQLAAAS